MKYLCAVVWMGLMLGRVGMDVAAAQDVPPMLLRDAASVTLMERGRAQLIAFRMQAAEQTFRALAARPGGEAAAYYHLALAALQRGLMTDEAVHFDTFFDRVDTLHHVLERAPPTPWRTYLEAEAHLQTAIAWAKTNHHLRAAWAARSAYADFERVVKAAPDFDEAYKGLGVLHVALGSLPGAYRSLLSILGYRGSVEQGIAELERAARRSRYNREEAGVYLALTRSILFQETQASVEILAAIHARHPDSPLFSYLYAYQLLANRRAAEAERVLQAVVQQAQAPGVFDIHYVDYYLADALFKQDRFEEAVHAYRRYLARHQGPALKATANLELGLALEMLGRRAEALPYYRQVEQPDRSFDSDEVALRAVARLLRSPMTPVERTLLLGRNAYDSGRYEEAVRVLTGVLQDPDATVTDRAEAQYRLGRVYEAQGRLDEALAAYAYPVEHAARIEPGARWAPWAQFYIGEIHARRGETVQARRAYERAGGYTGPFDYDQALEQSIKVALERLDG